MSFGGSLGSWDNANIFSREIKLFKALIDKNIVSRIYFVSYDSRDLDNLKLYRLKYDLSEAFCVLVPPQWFSCTFFFNIIYSFAIPLLF